mmetsp:Transcript_3605/g.6293  ORF Transcript_3605/g.6293 Transcript_3605/m.6293 type:complete len:81 (-) Transcript_3605:819-1061(-)
MKNLVDKVQENRLIRPTVSSFARLCNALLRANKGHVLLRLIGLTLKKHARANKTKPSEEKEVSGLCDGQTDAHHYGGVSD